MIDVFDGEIELVFMALRVAAIFGAAIGQHALQLDAFSNGVANAAVAVEPLAQLERLAVGPVKDRLLLARIR